MGKSPRITVTGNPARERAEIDMLEQTVSLDGPVARRPDARGLQPTPIRPAWILEGEPQAREKLLAHSTDGGTSVHLWDCTSGRFQWTYVTEEIVHVVAGAAIVEVAGARRRLQAGDTHVFPAGSQCRWAVPDYVHTMTCRLSAAAPSPLKRRIRAALAGTRAPRNGRAR
ncbi:MAG: cupin domain-containing protein [Steroidobacteraceae bacterium]